jgi:hypothetical protein
MKKPVMDGGNILVAGGSQESLCALTKKVLEEHPAAPIETAPTWEETVNKVTSRAYRLVVVDLSPAGGLDPARFCDFLRLAVSREVPVALAPSPFHREAPIRPVFTLSGATSANRFTRE